MTPADVAALVRGLHADPFAVLGPHETGGDLAVRAFWPGAAAIDLVTPGGDVRAAMNRVHEAGLFEVTLPKTAREDIDYRLRITEDGGRTLTLDDPYRYGPVLTDFDLHLFGEGTHVRGFDKLGARPITHGIRDGVHFAVWAPNARRVSAWSATSTGGTAASTRCGRCTSGYWEIFIPDLRVGERYKFEVLGADGRTVLKADPYGRYFEMPPRTASIVWNSDGYAWGDAAWMAARAGAEPVAEAADVDLRGAPGQLAARAGGAAAHLSRDGRRARALREGDGLHAHRAAAGDGASVHRLVGLSGDRLLRADQPLRHAGGFQGVRRRLPPGRHRRDPRLGAGPLPEGSARPGALRRHRALRARRSRARASTRTGAR